MISRTIDAHIHFGGDHPDCIAMIEARNLTLLNVCFVPAPGALDGQRDLYRRLAAAHPSRYAWCTSFEPPDFKSPSYAEQVIAGLEQDFRAGACACKIWKNIGMDVRKASGEYLMVDDPLFDPIFRFLQRAGRPVLMHVGEPRECWQPLDPDSAHYDYYSQHPQWHMYGKAGFPSHAALIEARDHVLARYPEIRFIGAHLGSLEYDLAELAKRLDLYPNFMADSSARMMHFFRAETLGVRQFLTKYDSRILYGSDFVSEESQASLPAAQRESNLAQLEAAYEMELGFLRSKDSFTYQGRRVTGLGLPEPIVGRLTFQNAQQCYGL